MSTFSLRRNRTSARALAGACSLAAALAACGGGHHLAEYPFSSRTLAVVYLAPPSPELLTSYYDLRNSQNPIEAVVRAGADVAREREGRRAKARLDSAAARIDIPTVLAQRTLQRASRYLGTRPTTDENQADYLMEVRMERFGINAKADEATYLFTFAEAVLIDRRTGRVHPPGRLHVRVVPHHAFNARLLRISHRSLRQERQRSRRYEQQLGVDNGIYNERRAGASQHQPR